MQSVSSRLINRHTLNFRTNAYPRLALVVGFIAISFLLWQQPWLEKTSFAPMTPRRAFGAALLNGQVYAVGGWNGTATQLDLVEVLDPSSGAWTVAPPLNRARSQHAVIAADDQLWVIGGWSAETGLVSAVERFSPNQSPCHPAGAPWALSPCQESDGAWEIVTHLPTPRREPGVALWGRQLVVAGGFDGVSDADLDGYSDRVEAYDLDQGEWRRLANLRVPRRGLALVSVNDHLFAIGGYTVEGGFTNVVEEYDSGGKRWVIHSWSLAPRTWATTAVVDGAILIAGGYNREGFLGLVERVDPRTSQMCQPPPLGTPRSWFAVVPTSAGLLALGGETQAGFTGAVEKIDTDCE